MNETINNRTVIGYGKFSRVKSAPISRAQSMTATLCSPVASLAVQTHLERILQKPALSIPGILALLSMALSWASQVLRWSSINALLQEPSRTRLGLFLYPTNWKCSPVVKKQSKFESVRDVTGIISLCLASFPDFCEGLKIKMRFVETQWALRDLSALK